MKLKRNIAACTGVLLVLVLGVAMVCGGCKQKTPEWTYDPTHTSGEQNDNSTTTGDTAGNGGGQSPSEFTDAFNDPNAPSVEIGIVDREELDSTTGDTTGGTTGGTTDTPAPSTKPVSPTEPSYDDEGYMTYESYMALTGEEQMAYCKSFPTLKDFNAWFNAAKEAYDAAHPKETIGPDGNIDLNP